MGPSSARTLSHPNEKKKQKLIRAVKSRTTSVGYSRPVYTRKQEVHTNFGWKPEWKKLLDRLIYSTAEYDAHRKPIMAKGQAVN
jgi:hypothetical protein